MSYSRKLENMFKAKKIKIGDRIIIFRGKKKFEGMLLPRSELGDENSIVIKLDSGYNIGIRFFKGMRVKKSRSKEPKAIAKQAEFEFGKWHAHLKKKMKHDPKKPIVSILHMGGTVASRVDYKTGGVVASFTPEDIIGMFPELADIANIRSRMVRNMWSGDMRFAHYQVIAKEIAKEISKGVDGVIITHGTDTMHYTSAALSFMLQDLPIPVILVGAQRSSDRPSSDAFLNLVSAVKFIVNSDYAGVAVCMHENISDNTCLILPGTKFRKLHTSRRDAFRPINVTPIAIVGDKIRFVKRDFMKKAKRKLKLKTKMEDKVIIIRVHPNMHSDVIKFASKYKGVVLEGTGLGHAPVDKIDNFTEENQKILEEIRKLCRKSIVVMCSQAVYGRINMNVYNYGIKLQRAGVIPGEDMTPETCLVKLSWLLGNFPKKAREMVGKNLVGEISERTEMETFLV